MQIALALIPVAGLLAFIYFNDKKEKEPVGLLVSLFFAGMSTAIPAFFAEVIGELIINLVLPGESMIKAVIIASCLVAPAEEMGKYLILRAFTWKNKQFDYSYDAIVYAVFTSLGFAAIENIGYVFSHGIGTAILRMFTAVPGHACFAVFMGYFYSKARYAQITNDAHSYSACNVLSLAAPIFLHGVYDAIVMAGGATDSLILSGLSLLLWGGFVFVMIGSSCLLVIYAAKNDFCFVRMPDNSWTYYSPAVAGNWQCACGKLNQLNFCSNCGSPRPQLPGTFNGGGYC